MSDKTYGQKIRYGDFVETCIECGEVNPQEVREDGDEVVYADPRGHEWRKPLYRNVPLSQGDPGLSH